MSASGERVVVLPFIQAFGGVERLSIGLSRHLHQAGRPHRIVTLDDTIELARHASWPLRVEVLRAPRNSFAEAWALERRLRREALPPLFFDLKGAFYAGLSRLERYALHLTDPPSLLPRDLSKHAPSARRAWPAFTNEPPGPARRLRAELVHRINRRGARRARVTIAMTRRIAAELEALYGVRASVLRPGIALPEAPASGPVGRAPRLLSISRLESSKRVDWILRAAAQLSPRDFTLDIVGDGAERASLESLTARLGLSEVVRFHGRITDEEVEALWARATLFLMPAVQGYGLPALEALARGVPVVAHADSGVSEILEGSPWVELMRGGEAELGAAIERLQQRTARGLGPAPAVPTEAAWAEALALSCGWG